MFKYLFAVGYTAACLCAATNTMALAQTPSSGDDRQRTAILENIKKSVIQTVGAQEKTVEVAISGNILTVARVNSNLNDATHDERNNEAIAIAPVVTKAIEDSPEFKTIHTIRVQYLVRRKLGEKGKVLDTVDFRKDSNGKFQFHET
jgi:hypothetical protein